ncbi:polynucleotide adenylyltransferase [Candidatus Roizmanbacteria bacterium CG22_combo_CG10-13_8_21_14_all_35_9]|uniref:Polynucleotide adenylyltransferase n=4 Tax=Candidatus Roizmaniibacteriota TaxID=1752723 RepID=A0A2M8F1I3_9BACT|nr:MAG: polynucleotide adenylyltransferase [Candidatus Roizmanbacteria bacterium CG23_combo_of_CG06-09_8_20_14_all_35_49]PIP62216.1 MAG: polynucleotide adenylyltransferase [Candidatus Roizmanbacteria bacterium CG22_combo_CG10-13_8_21_14_all_35_9]PIY71287.1 MAG: polynucleotide adenylyltransferase [Candidatus Roizmanbacteria bacterium CG_4_10_14_0_8_um_filter_35_28]PJC33153.1 MAG: polynucleotide adenylyltransferase [Candidatus Roizmanbacteria bacterium CG_4_9_14_0_2_um_filter_35_15]PJC84158.1 MAG
MFKLSQKINDLFSFFKKKGFQLYLVGGAIRDLLLKKEPKNWDFATDAKPEEILKLFPKGHYNNQYGTVIVKIDDQLLEITTLRKEEKYEDFRHPENVIWTNKIEEDLARRDFSINALVYDGKKIIDLFNGQKHLKEKLIVAVGNPDKRFNEDALRLIRAVRFASQLGFFIDEKTRASIEKNAELISKISWERIRDEFLKILGSDHPAEGVLFLKNTGLLSFILPEVDLCFMVPQKSPLRHHIYDVGTHLVMSLKHCPSKDEIVRFATLIHDVGKAKTFRKDEKTGLITFYNHEVVGTKQTKQIADRFKLSNKNKDKLVKLVQFHQFTVSEIQTDKAVRRFIRNVGQEYLDDIIDLRIGDRIGSGARPTSWRFDLFKKRLEEVQKQPFQIKDLKIDGNDVMKVLKLKPGPKIGEVLKNLFDLVVEKKLKNERKALLQYINIM